MSKKKNINSDLKNKGSKINQELEIFIRYFLIFVLIIIFLSNFFNNVLIEIFTFIAYYFLLLFAKVQIIDNFLLINNTYTFIIIKECIASSAYIFIAFILLSLPIRLKKNLMILLKSVIVFTIVNLVRILFLMWIHIVYGTNVYDKFHLIFYEGVSGVLVALIIIYYLKKEKIKKIYPIVTDIKYLIKIIRKKD
jgi:exosortase/archaeosortase family protein